MLLVVMVFWTLFFSIYLGISNGQKITQKHPMMHSDAQALLLPTAKVRANTLVTSLFFFVYHFETSTNIKVP